MNFVIQNNQSINMKRPREDDEISESDLDRNMPTGDRPKNVDIYKLFNCSIKRKPRFFDCHTAIQRKPTTTSV